MVFVGYDTDGECLWDYPNGDNMTKPLDEDFNATSPITKGGISLVQPKMAKGGVYAPADVKLIKDALVFYVRHNGNITEQEESQVVNLMHRLNNRT